MSENSNYSTDVGRHQKSADPLSPALLRFPKNRWWALLVIPVLLIALHAPILRGAAAFLIVQDPLQKAAAIVALGGQAPFRQIEAARLYHAGWAPLVFVVQEGPSDESEAFRLLGIKFVPEWELSRQVLLQQGVPASAIIVPIIGPDGKSIGTLEELQAVYKELNSQRLIEDVRREGLGVRGTPGHKEHGAGSTEPTQETRNAVILVTSKYHTRRTRLTWQYVSGGRSQAIVRAAVRDPFDPSKWWRDRGFILSVVREYLGLINYYAGFPVTP